MMQSQMPPFRSENDLRRAAVRMHRLFDLLHQYAEALPKIPLQDRQEVHEFCQEFRSCLRSVSFEVLRLLSAIDHDLGCPAPQWGMLIQFPSLSRSQPEQSHHGGPPDE